MTKTELFIELARPNSQGISRWVRSTEFVDRYADLQLGNGGSWCRASSSLAKIYNVHRISKTQLSRRKQVGAFYGIC